MKQLEVSIMGQSYLLACPTGGEAALTRAVAAVDAEMCAIRDAGKVRARERIAVLAALNLAYQLSNPPSPAPAPATVSDDGHSVPDLAGLVARLDQALANDGNLL
jgi:cell division protein ZapA